MVDPGLNTLTEQEMQFVRSMRCFDARAKDYIQNLVLPSSTNSEPVWKIDDSLRRFLFVLKQNDPFVVNLLPYGEVAVSVFELQVLYAVASCRKGDMKTVEALLSWWLPAKPKSIAKVLLLKMAQILDIQGFAQVSPIKLQSLILKLITKRIGRQKVPKASTKIHLKTAIEAGCYTLH